MSAVSISTRTRFEVFKRDDFTCRYCGKKSPQVILEVDHIIPICDGGTDDRINLTTACWDCNRGKGGIALAQVMTAEDPHEKAILILESERQLAEYNAVIKAQRERIADDMQALVNRWCDIIHKRAVKGGDVSFLRYCLRVCPVEKVLEFMDVAEDRGIRRLQYVHGCLKNWLSEQPEADDVSNY